MSGDNLSLQRLSESFLSNLVAEIDQTDFVGILLGGSHARGDATELSDVDIACIVSDKAKLRPKRFTYRDGLLVSIGIKSIEGIRADLSRPDTAIWAARGIGDCRVLSDKDGSVATLLEEVRAFSWETVREAANQLASFRLMLAAEMAQKVTNELAKGDEPTMSFAVAKLFAELTAIMAIGRGVLVKSDSTYYQQVEDAAGPSWTRYHQAIAGIGGPISIPEQAHTALQLYRETAVLLRAMMLPEHRDVVDEAVRLTLTNPANNL